MRVPFRSVLLQSLLVLTPLAYAQTAPVQSLVVNWNLVGNNSPLAINPVSLFGNASAPIAGISDQITSVWKWNAPGVSWMFYAPSLDPTGLAAYALTKSYDVLSSIPSGDGYWVNAKAPLTLTLPSGTPPATAPVQTLVSGWNLAGNNTTAAIDPITLFGNTSTPLSGITSQIVTVWTWDAVNAGWMFYAPSLTSTALATYAASKGYGVLTTILPGDGFWVNSVAALSLALPPVISGVAASGAPIANATVTLTCGDGSTRTTTTDSNGAYAVNRANCSEPWVITVTGAVGDTLATLVSFQATPAANDAMLTINVTPLTDAIAATLASSGVPVDLSTNFSAEKANITEAKANARKNALVGALFDTLTAAGIDPATFDIVSTKFNADRTGMDKVLDNVKVQVMPTGVSMTNVGGVKVDDMGDNPPAPSADLAGETVSFNNATDFTAALPKLPAALDDHSIGDTVRDALNACFAQAAAARGTFAARLGACQTLPIAADYKHDGRNGSQEFDGYLTNALYDNAQFARPEIIRFFSSTDTDTRALIKFALTRSDGVVESFMTVGEKSILTGGVKQLRGNQRPFKAFVSGSVHKRMQVASNGTNANKQKSTFYGTGIDIHFGFKEGGAGGSSNTTTWNSGSLVSYVKVTGPGLPAAGVFLNPALKGCDSYFAIAATSTGTPPNCTKLFRVSSRAATATDTDNFASKFGSTDPAYPSAKMSDADIQAIQPQSAYKFEVWRVGNTSATPDHVFYERLRGRPYTMGSSPTAQDGEVDRVRWDALSADTIALIDPTSSTTFAGGFPSTFPAKWTNTPYAAPIGNIQVQTRQTAGTTLYQDQINVRFSANSAGLSNANQGGWPDMKTTTSTGLNFVQGTAHNRFDTQLVLDYIY